MERIWLRKSPSTVATGDGWEGKKGRVGVWSFWLV